MLQERLAKLVPGRQRVRQPGHERSTLTASRLGLGTATLPAVHASGGGGDAPSDDRRLAPLDGGERLPKKPLGLGQAPCLQGDLCQ